MPSVNFTGLASGLDTKALIDAILQAEREPISKLEARVQVFNTKRAAFDELASKLDAFESALRGLASDRSFRGRTTHVGDDTFLAATAAPGAEAGLFEIEVVALAAAHKIRSAGFATRDEAELTDGTLTIQSGDNDPIAIEVSAARGNNSLAAIRDEINAADAGVQAAVIFDGTDYLLTIRAEESGTANSLVVSDGVGLGLDTVTPVTVAADALIEIDGVAITHSSNRITGVISGVTLDLRDTTEPGETVTVEVAQDIDGVVDAVQKVVQSFNDLAAFFDQQDNRDNPGPLAGDSVLRTVESRVASLFTGGLPGIPLGGIRSLSSLGVSFDGKTGQATLDTSDLRELLETRFDEVGDLFLSSGRADDPRVQFLGGGFDTVAGEYAVHVTTAAEQATVVGGSALGSSSGIGGGGLWEEGTLAQDETLTVTVGDDLVEVDLLAGDDMVTVVDRINTALDTAGIDARAEDDAGFLRLSTSAYGTAAQLTVVSSVAAGAGSSGIGQAELSDTGVDVAGTIGGLAATGAGRVLTGAEDTAVAGLNLRITATASDVTAAGGAFGTTSFSRGFVDTLLQQVTQFTRFGGTVDGAREAQEDNVKRIQDDIARIEDRLLVREARLLRTFAAAERAISLLQGQQSTLGGAGF